MKELYLTIISNKYVGLLDIEKIEKEMTEERKNNLQDFLFGRLEDIEECL